MPRMSAMKAICAIRIIVVKTHATVATLAMILEIPVTAVAVDADAFLTTTRLPTVLVNLPNPQLQKQLKASYQIVNLTTMKTAQMLTIQTLTMREFLMMISTSTAALTIFLEKVSVRVVRAASMRSSVAPPPKLSKLRKILPTTILCMHLLIRVSTKRSM